MPPAAVHPIPASHGSPRLWCGSWRRWPSRSGLSRSSLTAKSKSKPIKGFCGEWETSWITGQLEARLTLNGRSSNTRLHVYRKTQQEEKNGWRKVWTWNQAGRRFFGPGIKLLNANVNLKHTSNWCIKHLQNVPNFRLFRGEFVHGVHCCVVVV